jgi:hypothetical protein
MGITLVTRTNLDIGRRINLKTHLPALHRQYAYDRITAYSQRVARLSFDNQHAAPVNERSTPLSDVCL